MSKRINSYQAVAAFVRGFFEAYARGIIDATIEGNDFSKKKDPVTRSRAQELHMIVSAPGLLAAENAELECTDNGVVHHL